MRNLLSYFSIFAMFMCISLTTYSQLKLFSTTTSTTDANTNIYHLGNILLGDNNSGNILGKLTI